MKDIFSKQANDYAKYRPVYPQDLYDFILRFVPEKKLAWDCGTGNGQTANILAQHFENVFASDISQGQLDNAILQPNIIYRKEPVELSSLTAGSVNLFCISQALHWFQLDDFYKEVQRVAAPGAVIAAWTYNLFKIDNFTNAHINDFYEQILKGYWDAERKYVDENYRNIPFPFENISCPAFTIKVNWSVEALEGFLNSWSAVHKFITENNFNPVPHVIDKIKKRWRANEEHLVTFPVSLKLGYVFPK